MRNTARNRASSWFRTLRAMRDRKGRGVARPVRAECPMCSWSKACPGSPDFRLLFLGSVELMLVLLREKPYPPDQRDDADDTSTIPS